MHFRTNNCYIYIVIGACGYIGWMRATAKCINAQASRQAIPPNLVNFVIKAEKPIEIDASVKRLSPVLLPTPLHLHSEI
uniref:Uncharacterized protein n=1 Tax=Bionectria ochroleuca TaxID=29856 RepID=A0A0B7K2L6_BIOOC